MDVFMVTTLGVFAGIDWKWKKVPACLCIGFILFAAAGVCMGNYADRMSAFFGAFLGVFLFVLSFLTRGAIGPADGAVFVATGILLGFWKNMILLTTGLVFHLIFTAVLLGIGRIRGKEFSWKKEIPFLPFVFLAYLQMQAGIF